VKYGVPVTAVGTSWISQRRQSCSLNFSLPASSHAKRLMQTAHSPEEFGQIAAYLDRQAEMYAAKCEAEEMELDRLLALSFHARSYPAQVEGTRNRIDYFKALSHRYSDQADLYHALANADGTKGGAAILPLN
jgi:hypothetical protein